MAVTRDATSGIWYPATAAEVTALYSGRGIGAPVHGYKCDEAAGNLADFIGSVPLVKFNAPSYHNAFPGHSRLAIGYQANNDCHFVSPVAAGDVGDISNVSSSVLMFTAAANGLGSAPPTSVKNLLNLGASPNDRHFAWSASSKFAVTGTGQATGNGTASPGVAVHGTIFEVNRTGTAFVGQTDQETIAPTYTAPAGGSAYLSVGPDSVGDAGQTVVLVAYMLMWASTAAEFTAAQRASILDCHYNGPAVASIALTPTPVALASIGSTQQLTATATRTDATTFDCTDGTNVPSTAVATWASDNPSVATVSATGLVTAVAAGVANITRTFTSLNAATATSNASVVTVSGVTVPSVVPALNSVLTFLRFDEPLATIAPSDALKSLSDLTPISTTPTVVNAFCGFGRQLGNGLAFTATDASPGATLTTRDVTIQAILSWDMAAQVALGTDGTIVARGRGATSAEYVAYALQLHVVNAALQIGELELWWQDNAGGVHIEPGGQFVLPPAGSFMMLTAVRHWVDATHVEVRYYAGDQLLAEFLTSDGDIGGGTTGTFCVGARYSGGTPGNYLCGVIDELRVLNYELTAEEIGATWARISTLQPRAYSAIRQLMQPGAPITNDPSSRIQKILRIAGHLLGYAAAQAENMRLNMLPDRAYGATLAQHEGIVGEAPAPRDSVQTRRKRLLGHLRQKAGVSIPGIAASVADLLAIGKSQVQVQAFDNTIRDDFSLGLRNTLWMADDPAQWAVSSAALHVTGANAAALPFDGTNRTWYTCLAAALGSRVSADGRPTAANDTTNYFDGRGCHILAKMSPTTLPSQGEVGVVFYNLAKGNALLFGLRNLAGSYSLVTETFANWVSGGVTVQAASSLTTHWLHLWQNAHPGWSAGNRFYNAAWSTTGQLTGYTTSADIQHVAEFNWMGFYLRTFGGGTLAAAADVAFDDVIMRHPYGSRPFRFYVYRDPTLPGTPDLVGAEAAVKRLQQAHTSGHVITTKSALCDTVGAGCDRAPMGGY